MKRITCCLKLAVIAVILLISPTLSATRFRVAVQNFQFVPKNLPSVKIGDTIRWYWAGGSHTITSDTIPAGASSWDHSIDATDTVFEYVITTVGTYKYHCTPHELVGMVGSFTATPLGVNEIAPPVAIFIYPNPVVDNLNIHIGSPQLYVQHLWIFNVIGRLIDERSFVSSPGSEDKTVNLAEIPNGVLFLEFVDNANNKYVRKVVKK